MLVGQSCGNPPARRAIQKANLDQNGSYTSSRASSSSASVAASVFSPHRPAIVLFDDRHQKPPVKLVEAVRIDFKQLQRLLCRGAVDLSRAAHLGEVAHATQQPVGNTRRAAANAMAISAAPSSSMGTFMTSAERSTMKRRSSSV